MVGYTRDELSKKPFHRITHTDDLDADLDQVERMLKGEIEQYSMEKRYLKKDGSIVWANLRVSFARRAMDQAGHFVSVVEDITKQKKAEAILKVLSPREVEVLSLMSQGLTNAEIADALTLSPNTVKTHVKSITSKLGVADRTQAAVYAVEVGLVSPGFAPAGARSRPVRQAGARLRYNPSVSHARTFSGEHGQRRPFDDLPDQ